jgi:hypothetical protein
MGWLFRKINIFIEDNSSKVKGKIIQALCCGLKEELNEYYRLIAILENLKNE